jgi:hypothetical protein
MTASRPPGEHEAQTDAAASAAKAAGAVSPPGLELASQIGNRAFGRLMAGGARPRRLARWEWGDVLEAAAEANPFYQAGKAIGEHFKEQPQPQGLVQTPSDTPAQTPTTTQPSTPTDTGPTPTQPKPTVEIPTSDWVEGSWVDPSFKGQQDATDTKATKQELFDAITKVAPHMPRALRICMVGQAWVEQGGKGITNFNYFGREGGGTPAFTLAWTSTYVPLSVYLNDPDKDKVIDETRNLKKYNDWDFHHHNPNFGVNAVDHKAAGTIAVQLERDPPPKQLTVVMQKPRPAFQSLLDASVSFVHLIETRVRKLAASPKPEHRALAQQVYDGDPKAYANMVNHKFVIPGAKGKDNGFGAYNDNASYSASVIKEIAAANADLPQ